MLVEKVKQHIYKALEEADFAGYVAGGHGAIPVETPRTREFGHYSTSIPFALKKELKRAPMEIAERIASLLPRNGLFESVETAKPGFINFKIAASELRSEVARIRAEDDAFGSSDTGAGRKVQVEYVSANPTGPLSIGHGRLAAFGDALAAILRAAGFEVETEFYVNDVGNQIQRLAGSVEKRMRQLLGQDAELEKDDYQGEYLLDMASSLLKKYTPAILDKPEEERRKILAEDTIVTMLGEQRATLESFKVRFDNWFRESALHNAGALGEALEILKKGDAVYEKDDAIWFASTRFSDNEDRVLQKTSGATTYFMSDISYIKNKFDRGFNTAIYIWGADHHGYIERMKSAAAALGFDPAAIEILIVQLVRFKQGGEFVRMSKRKGNIVTLSDLVEEIGADVARFFFLMRTRESHLEFDLQLARDKSESNPLFYLQYAHARICSIIRKADAAGLRADNSALDKLALPSELELIKSVCDYPWEVQCAALSREPHRVITYLTDLASEFHAFYHDHRVIQEQQPELSAARLALCDAVRIVFRNTLRLLCLSAPEEM